MRSSMPASMRTLRSPRRSTSSRFPPFYAAWGYALVIHDSREGFAHQRQVPSQSTRRHPRALLRRRIGRRLQPTRVGACIVPRPDRRPPRIDGRLAAARTHDITASIDAVELAPFAFPLERIGAFPNLRRPNIVWVGLATPAAHPSPVRRDGPGSAGVTLFASLPDADSTRYVVVLHRPCGSGLLVGLLGLSPRSRPLPTFFFVGSEETPQIQAENLVRYGLLEKPFDVKELIRHPGGR